MNDETAHDAPITIMQLRKLVGDRQKSKLYELHRFGERRKSDGAFVRLEAFLRHGVLHTTLENYYRLLVQLDPNMIADLERYADGRRLCLAMCCACESWLKFKMDATKELKDEVLKNAYRWRRYGAEGWLCAKCQEGT